MAKAVDGAGRVGEAPDGAVDLVESHTEALEVHGGSVEDSNGAMGRANTQKSLLRN